MGQVADRKRNGVVARLGKMVRRTRRRYRKGRGKTTATTTAKTTGTIRTRRKIRI